MISASPTGSPIDEPDDDHESDQNTDVNSLANIASQFAQLHQPSSFSSATSGVSGASAKQIAAPRPGSSSQSSPASPPSSSRRFDPRTYREPDAVPVDARGGVARPWINWVRGMQSAAPFDVRGLIMDLFQRVFTMIFAGAAAAGASGGGGVGGGGLGTGSLFGRMNSDPRFRAAKMTQFRKTLANQLNDLRSRYVSSLAGRGNNRNDRLPPPPPPPGHEDAGSAVAAAASEAGLVHESTERQQRQQDQDQDHKGVREQEDQRKNRRKSMTASEGRKYPSFHHPFINPLPDISRSSTTDTILRYRQASSHEDDDDAAAASGIRIRTRSPLIPSAHESNDSRLSRKPHISESRGSLDPVSLVGSSNPDHHYPSLDLQRLLQQEHSARLMSDDHNQRERQEKVRQHYLISSSSGIVSA